MPPHAKMQQNPYQPHTSGSEPLLQREARASAERWLARFSPLLDDPQQHNAAECRRRIERIRGLRTESQPTLFGLQSHAGVEDHELLRTLRDAVEELDFREAEFRRRLADLEPGAAEGLVDLSSIRERIAAAEARREVEAVTGSRMVSPARLEMVTSPGNLGGAAMLGVFFLGWMSFTTLHASAMIWGMSRAFGWMAAFLLLFYSIFWAAGLAMGWQAFRMACKEHLAIEGRTLTVTRQLFGKKWIKRYQIGKDCTANISVSSSRNGNSIGWELVLTDIDGKDLRLGSGRQQYELQRKAEEINAYVRDL